MRKPPRHCHCYGNSHPTPHRHTGEKPAPYWIRGRYPVPGLRGQQTTPGCWRGAIFIPLCGLRKAMVILNEAKRSEESNTTSPQIRHKSVIPAKAGIQSPALDCRLHRGDDARADDIFLYGRITPKWYKIADCKTTSSVGRNPRFLATLGMTRRRGVGLIIATILFTYPYQPLGGRDLEIVS